MKQESRSEFSAAIQSQVAPDAGNVDIVQRLLLVDDHDVCRDMTRLMVQRLGQDMDAVGSWAEAQVAIAKAAAAHRPYALLLMDLIMPITDGIEAVQKLRASGIGCEVLPVVALTGIRDLREQQRFMDAGGQAWLEKPLSLDMLAAVLESQLATSFAIAPAADTTAISATLEQRFTERKLAVLSRIDAVITAGNGNKVDIDAIYDLLHKLAGSAGFFGAHELSNVTFQCKNALAGLSGDDAIAILQKYKDKLIHAL